MLRRLFFCLLTLAFFSPVCAHADTFTFTPGAAGASYTFTVGSTPDSTQVSNGMEMAVFYANNNTLAFYVLNDAYADQYASSGYGHVDAILTDSAAGVTYYLVGPQLFSGDVTNMSFTPGTYNLDSSPAAGRQGGGILALAAVAPEPSSFALLATGVLGVAGITRRRYLTV